MSSDSFECPKCGSEMFQGAHFCMRCGSRLDTPEVKPAPITSRPAPFIPSTMPLDEAAGSVAEALSRAWESVLPAADNAEPKPKPEPVQVTTLSDEAPSLRRRPGMPEHSRDEILRRVRAKQSLKRAGLAGIDLSGANLEGADFSRADLEGANLENAKLRGALLRNANLTNARLGGADLAQADLEKADVDHANLDGAQLQGTNLKRANLEESTLVGASLDGANLTGADLSDANLERASFKHADMSHADLSDTAMSGADLSDANLTSARLESATIEGCSFARANLADADLRGAEASGANFDGARLERACLEGTVLKLAQLLNVDARHAVFRSAELEGADLSGARLAGAVLIGVRAAHVRAEWVDVSELADNSRRLNGAAALSFIQWGEVPETSSATRYFGKGDVLRDATLEFGENSVIQIDSHFHNCSITLREGAELTIGEPGVLKDCSISGSGKIVVHGRFFERVSPGIAGARSVLVSARGGVVSGIEQASDSTAFAFEPGCRLRVKILRPRLSLAAE
jgi:uncharacterized protein YjbI with pentapeptide repeats